MHRPIKLATTGATAITLHRLHKELANDLTAHGEYFFKASDLLDVFGLAHTPEETRDAIEALLTITKQLKTMDCQLINHAHPCESIQVEYASLCFLQSQKIPNWDEVRAKSARCSTSFSLYWHHTA